MAYVARGPETESAVLRCDTSMKLAAPISSSILPSGSNSRSSSGPSHSSARSPLIVARHGGGTSMPIEPTAAGPPLMSRRVAGGSAFSCTAAQSGDAAASTANGWVRSSMQTLAIWVVGNRISHTHRNDTIRRRHIQRPANAFSAGGHECQRYWSIECFAPISRRDVAECGWRTIGVSNNLRTFLEHIRRQQANKLLAIRTQHVGSDQ